MPLPAPPEQIAPAEPEALPLDVAVNRSPLEQLRQGSSSSAPGYGDSESSSEGSRGGLGMSREGIRGLSTAAKMAAGPLGVPSYIGAFIPGALSAINGDTEAAANQMAGAGLGLGLNALNVPGYAIGPAVTGIMGFMNDRPAGEMAESVANSAIGSLAGLAGPIGGAAYAIARALGFNPAQGIGESLGMYEGLTPGYQGGFWGDQGIGTGIQSTPSNISNFSPAGASPGSNVSAPGMGGSLGGGISGSYSGGSYSGDRGGSPGASAPGMGGSLGGGISVGPGGGVSTSGLSNASDSDSGSRGGGGGGGKIVCTAMNQAYGFGGFRNTIWLAYAAKNLTPYHEKGYHAIFQPLVKYAFESGDSSPKRVVRSCLEWYAKRRSSDLRQEMRGKNPTPYFRKVRRLSEYVCYVVGKLVGVSK